MSYLARLSGAVLLCAAAFCQSETTPAKFDVADVHTSPRGTRESGVYLHGGRMEMHGVTMLSLLQSAYEVKPDRIFGGPNWLDTTRFDIVAKAAGPFTQADVRPMLQSLLAERFGLSVKKEDKPEPVYALVATRKVQLKKVAGEETPNCKRANEDGYLVMTCTNISMAALAERLPGAAPNYFNHPVVDKTGLEGAYDVTLKWSGRGQLGGGDPDHPGISLFNYMEKELGIKVEPQTVSSTGLVIEHLNGVPSPNPPGTLEKLPPPITEFEVAEVRPSKPDTKQDFNMKNGRIEAMAITMRDLIGFAYNLDDYMLPEKEGWLDSDKFDIIAKAPPVTTDGTLQAMLRTLLQQRFHLKVHEEQQPVTVYSLTAPKGKGKLKESTGEEHAGCTRTPKDGAFVYTCHNTTMAQFVQRLAPLPGAAGYFSNHPLLDLTGLNGSYDFEITWSPPIRVYGRGGGGGASTPPTGGVATATAPTGGITVFEAIEKQMGLKLAQDKQPMTVFVIDHVDRTPTEN